jgi:hypothetical protein
MQYIVSYCSIQFYENNYVLNQKCVLLLTFYVLVWKHSTVFLATAQRFIYKPFSVAIENGIILLNRLK